MTAFLPDRCAWAIAALGLALSATACIPAVAQQAISPRRGQLVHLPSGAMSAADSSVVQTRQSELVQAARIYGYDLEAENWSYEQTLCAPLPETILLHYRRVFPDGTESLFTALVPRGPGRIRIVPVLYRNTTPFVPAPKNPRNYALYNDLVPQAIASREIASNGNWLELSACYGEMTGARINLPPGSTVSIGVAGAPTATIHIDPQDETTRVTFADRATEGTYRVWSISFNRYGRVTAAGTEDYPIYMAKQAPSPEVQVQPVVAAQMPEVSQPEPAKEPVTVSAQPEQTAVAAAPANHAVQPPVEMKSSVAASHPPVASEPTAVSQPPAATPPGDGDQNSEPGWKFIPEPPPPPEKTIPDPPDPWNNAAPANPPPK